ncbi:MAG: DNA/RNA nuclease SfsA [Spirochaetaceae bacterium]|jgi:sugar fermentation stimulation protein A|nr:DNA/RNA nuclease SfsA [Spirochaetaceae bacterium]
MGERVSDSLRLSGSDSVRLFTNDREAVFIRRPNRFLIIAGEEDGREDLACHCPNPGRLIEFVFPGTRLILEKRVAGAEVRKGAKNRNTAKTGFTAAGLYYRSGVVPLFSSRANHAAERLILRRIIPGLRELYPEFTLGSSRFDFLCIDADGQRHLVEVKACSLVEYGVAMFPDAPSGRALKHLEELAVLTREGYRCHVLFVIVHGKPRVFTPNLHTDPAFAAALSRCGTAEGPAGPASGTSLRDCGGEPGRVSIHAALLRCDRLGKAVLARDYIPVDLGHGALAGSDCGNYLVILELPRDRDITVGSLGTINFEQGWYVYAGSARRNLSRRISRHLRKIRKLKHWHLDYLTCYAGRIKAFPIFSYRNLECELARRLRELGGKAIMGFGSSDCRCGSHLYYFTEPPMGNRAFVEMLLRFRHVEGLKGPAPGPDQKNGPKKPDPP